MKIEELSLLLRDIARRQDLFTGSERRKLNDLSDHLWYIDREEILELLSTAARRCKEAGIDRPAPAEKQQ